MFETAKSTIKPTCPFATALIAPKIEELVKTVFNDPDNGLDTASQIAFSGLTVRDTDFEDLAPVVKTVAVSKVITYQIAKDLLDEVVDSIKRVRANFPETYGLAKVQSAEGTETGQIALSATKLEIDTSKAKDLRELIIEIASAQISLCKSVGEVIIRNHQIQDLEAFEMLDRLVSQLPARSADTFLRFITSGFEAACFLPQELFRISFLVAKRELGEYGRDFSADDLMRIYDNSTQLLTLIARLPFTEFRETMKTLAEPGYQGLPWKLDPAKFTIKGERGERSLHCDLADISDSKVAKLGISSTLEVELLMVKVAGLEFNHGCIGMQYISYFVSWAKELCKAYVLPKLTELN